MNEMEGKWPVAWVTAVIPVQDRVNNVQLLKVGKCPLCSKPHTHGGGKIGEPLLLGHRVAHCLRTVDPGGYIFRLNAKSGKYQSEN
jgi:hypothetical protein